MASNVCARCGAGLGTSLDCSRCGHANSAAEADASRGLAPSSSVKIAETSGSNGHSERTEKSATEFVLDLSTRYFIDGVETTESSFENWIYEAADGEHVFARTSGDGQAVTWKYFKHGSKVQGGTWHSFSGSLENLYMDDAGMIAFLRRMRDNNTIVSNQDFDSFDVPAKRLVSHQVVDERDERASVPSPSSPNFVPSSGPGRSLGIGCLAVAIVFAAIVFLIVGLANAGKSSTSGAGDSSSNSQVGQARTEQEITSDLCAESDQPLATLFDTIYADTITSSSWEEFGSAISRGQETSSLLPLSNEVKSGFDLMLEWSALPVQTAMDSVDSSGIEQFVIGCLTNGSELTEVQSVMDAN